MGLFEVDTSVFKNPPENTEKVARKRAKKAAGRIEALTAYPIREPYKKRPVALPEGWQDVFLDALRMVPIVAPACRKAGVSRMSSWRYYEEDEDFAKAWEDALLEGKEKHLEILVEMRDNGNEKIAMFLARIWNLGLSASQANKEEKVVVGWEN